MAAMYITLMFLHYMSAAEGSFRTSSMFRTVTAYKRKRKKHKQHEQYRVVIILEILQYYHTEGDSRRG